MLVMQCEQIDQPGIEQLPLLLWDRIRLKNRRFVSVQDFGIVV